MGVSQRDRARSLPYRMVYLVNMQVVAEIKYRSTVLSVAFIEMTIYRHCAARDYVTVRGC